MADPGRSRCRSRCSRCSDPRVHDRNPHRAEDLTLDEGGPLPPRAEPCDEGRTLAAAVEEAERRTIEAAVTRCEGDLAAVARDLGVSATTQRRKMTRLGLHSRGAPPP